MDKDSSVVVGGVGGGGEVDCATMLPPFVAGNLSIAPDQIYEHRHHHVCIVVLPEQPIAMFSFTNWVIKPTHCYSLFGQKSNTHVTMNRPFLA